MIFHVIRSFCIFALVLFLGTLWIDGASSRAESRPPSASFDHLKYDALLKKYVVNGRVRYPAWVKSTGDRAALEKYILSFGEAPTSRMSANTRLAFYINAYNAITIKSVIDAYPVKSIKDIPEVWDRKIWKIGGQMVSLDDIENKIIRPGWKDPRVHFALVCAAKGCPPIINRSYNAMVIDQDLREVTTKFLSDSRRTTIDYTRKTLSVSRIFEWYKDDFIANEGTIPGYLARYLTDAASQADLRRGNWKIQYFEYDWALNETGHD